MKNMTLCKSLQKTIKEAKKTDSYWIEATKIDFSSILEEKRIEANMSYADLARALGTSNAYISKVFRGDANLTIESMVKLTRALGCNISIQVVKNSSIEMEHSFLPKMALPIYSFKAALESAKLEDHEQTPTSFKKTTKSVNFPTNDENLLLAA